MTDDVLSMAQVREMTGMGRSTIYEHMTAGTFPRPASRPRARLQWRKSDIDTWLAQQEAQRPENRERSQRELEKFAHSPRRGEREKRRRAASQPQCGDIAGFRASGFEDREQTRLAARLKPVDDRTRSRYERGGRYRRKFPGLMDALRAGWNGGVVPTD